MALGGCTGEPRYVVERVAVGPSPALRSLEAAGVASEALARSASRMLEAAPGFVSPADARRGARRFLGQLSVERAEVRAGAVGASPTALVVLTVSLEPDGRGGPVLRETGRGAASLVGGSQSLHEALERASQAALEAAVASFSARIAAEGKKKADLVRDLDSSEVSVREQAMRVLANRGERDAVPALVERLRDPDPEVRERAVGALAQLRDPRAVPALIAILHHRDARYVAQMARILGDIGGDEAHAWLVTMASGHPDASVREAAREALEDMTAREPHARTGTAR
jgi:hypothetical protein